MKIRSIAPIVLGCLLLFNCQNPFGAKPDRSSGSSASLTVSITAPAARTVTATASDYEAVISTLAIEVDDSSGATFTTPSNIAYSSGVTYTFQQISPGACTITVNAYDSSDALSATGSRSVTIAADSTQSVTVPLSITQSASTGGFSLAIRWPLSTGLAYISATLDGVAIAAPTVTADAANYSATLAKTNVQGGSRRLAISFKAAAAATTAIGPFLESINIWDGVTSSQWVDSSGNCVTERVFDASEFASGDCSLVGLSLSGGPVLAPTFNSSTCTYAFSGAALVAGTTYGFTLQSRSGSQVVTCAFNGTDRPLTEVSPTISNGSFTAISGSNTIEVVVTAADRQSKRTYKLITAAPIASSADLAMVSADLSGSYYLVSDITIPGDWTSIGGSTSSPFTGVFNGAGHTITYSTTTATGFFFAIGSSGVIESLGVAGTLACLGGAGGIAGDNYGLIAGCTSSVSINAGNHAGGIVATNYGRLSRCVSTGYVHGTTDHTGGIVGMSYGDVEYCHSSGTVDGPGIGKGGLIGEWVSGAVAQCYSTAAVSGNYAGGLIGSVAGTGLVCTNCYARGNVSGGSNVGGFIGGRISGGASSFRYCYATGAYTGTPDLGPFVGYNVSFSYASCYSTIAQGSVSVVLPAAGTTLPVGFSPTIWGVDPALVINNGYPYLLNL